MTPVRVIAYTQGRNVPSARFRVRQYGPSLAAHGVTVVESPARFGSYPPVAKTFRVGWAAAALLERSAAALHSRSFDVALLQREMISTLVSAERLTRRPRVLDIDDAIWLNGGDAFAKRLAGLADRIICGNSFLADKFSSWHDDIAILPTAVDTARFTAEPSRRRAGLIGWSGSSSGLPYLHSIESVHRTVLTKHKHARLRVVSDGPPAFKSIPHERVEFVRWTPDEEVKTIQEMAIGLMPLEETDWERGKCSYKMLLYAACGVPSVVTPVGMNAELLQKAKLGIGARTVSEWTDALDHFLTNPDDAVASGLRGRELAIKEFSIDVIGPRLAHALTSAAAGHHE